MISTVRLLPHPPFFFRPPRPPAPSVQDRTGTFLAPRPLPAVVAFFSILMNCTTRTFCAGRGSAWRSVRRPRISRVLWLCDLRDTGYPFPLFNISTQQPCAGGTQNHCAATPAGRKFPCPEDYTEPGTHAVHPRNRLRPPPARYDYGTFRLPVYRQDDQAHPRILFRGPGLRIGHIQCPQGRIGGPLAGRWS